MKAQREFLVPKKGLLIPNPETPGMDLPPDGAAVTVAGGRNDSYWRRRKRDEDVTVGNPPKPPKAPADAGTSTSK